MPAGDSNNVWYSYAVLRVVPRVDREEFVNAGVILFARTRQYLDAQVDLDEARLLALAPGIDLDEIKAHLASFQAVARGSKDAGEIAALPPSERFHWLTSPRSTILQTSAVHVGTCEDPAMALNDLMTRLVRLS